MTDTPNKRQLGNFPLCLTLTPQILSCSLLKSYFQLHSSCIILKMHHQIKCYQTIFNCISTFCNSFNIPFQMSIIKRHLVMLFKQVFTKNLFSNNLECCHMVYQ